MHFLSSERVQITYDLPLAEIVLDSSTSSRRARRGYASLDYEPTACGRRTSSSSTWLLGGDPVDALSMSCTANKGLRGGQGVHRAPAQAAFRASSRRRDPGGGGREDHRARDVKAYRKDVTAKCYGGDISRKRKLLEKQKEGQRRMKQVGRIEVPQEAFLAVLELGDGR